MDTFFNDNGTRGKLVSVYEHLQDAESRAIYKARSLFSLTDEREEMAEVIRNMTVAKELRRAVEAHAWQELVLFGAGTWGKAIRRFFADVPWSCFADNRKAGQIVEGLPVISGEQLLQKSHAFIVNAVLFKYREIEGQLLAGGVQPERMITLGRIAEERQYFDLPALPHDEHECLVDVGGYDGETSLAFTRWAPQYEHIYLFEPMAELRARCQQKLPASTCDIYPYGVWSSSGERFFSGTEENSNCSDEVNAQQEGAAVQVVALDDLLADKRVTFIKMDIEGSEIEALRGAKRIISEQKPKLAISVYHCRDDIWEIPKLILDYNPDYKFYLRIYSFTGNDTVLYAIP